MIKVIHISKIIENLSPKCLALPGDKIGLQVGSDHSPVKGILVTLDITEKVIDEAINKGCNLIVSHHPFIYNPISKLDFEDYKTKLILKLLKNNISVYVAHTNMDISPYGINNYLAKKIELKNIKPISFGKIDGLKKVVVYVPDEYKEIVRNKVLSLELFKTNKYSKTSFSNSGEGTFLPEKSANPFLGKEGVVETAKEDRLEFLTFESKIYEVIEEIKKIHPYEEMAYDIYSVENHFPQAGLGFYGELNTRLKLIKLSDLIKERLKIPALRIIGNSGKMVKKIGIVSGSGASSIHLIGRLKLDVLVTGDIKHHDACEILDKGLSIIDAGHYQTEKFFIPIIENILRKEIKIKIVKSKQNKDPFIFY